MSKKNISTFSIENIEKCQEKTYKHLRNVYLCKKFYIKRVLNETCKT